MPSLKELYSNIQLSKEEEEEAILQGKIKKFFHERNAEYWQEKENEKVKKTVGQKL
jgi:hypothetical protein